MGKYFVKSVGTLLDVQTGRVGSTDRYGQYVGGQ